MSTTLIKMLKKKNLKLYLFYPFLLRLIKYMLATPINAAPPIEEPIIIAMYGGGCVDFIVLKISYNVPLIGFATFYSRPVY